MAPKAQQLQIRVSRAQKDQLRVLAKAAGLDMSSYVLSRVLPPVRQQVQDLLALITDPEQRRFALAELNDVLSKLAGAELGGALEALDLRELSPLDRNYVAAMVELAAHRAEVEPPAWTRSVAPLPAPYFTTDLLSLRPHLLRAAPVPFKRRNIFIDSSLGSRV